MSTLSSEEGSGVESTGSLLFSLPSDAFDVQTDLTPPPSPASCGEKMRTPRDILDASRRLVQIAASASLGEVTPKKPPKQGHHRASSRSVANDEAGYDADGDGNAEEDGDRDGDKVVDKDTHTRTARGAGASGAGTTTTTQTRPVRRPTFLRIDTRQHRRVASMLATGRSGASYRDADTKLPLRARIVPFSPIRLKPSSSSSSTAAANANGNRQRNGEGSGEGEGESYELRQRPTTRREARVGLGIGFPENHPLRSRAFTMPVRGPVSPVADDHSPGPGAASGVPGAMWKERRPEWLCSPSIGRWKDPKKMATTQLEQRQQPEVPSDVHAPIPVRSVVLRPTFLEVSPSPIEWLPAGAFRND